MKNPIAKILLALSLCCWLTAAALAQETYDIKANYIKSEHQITMRDGVKLFVSVYAPKDTSQKYPMLMQRTPYSVAPYGAEAYRASLGPSPLLMKEGYIFVYQDVRGRNFSEGEFAWMRAYKPKKASATEADETTDTYDTIEWLLKNIPNNNGRVGMWGISYPGHYAAQALIDPHPALKAVSPQAPMADNWLGDDMHHNGAFFLPHAFNFIINFGRPRTGPGLQAGARFDAGTTDGYKFFLEMGALPNAQKYMKNEIKLWNEWMEHGDYDAYWAPQNVPQHLKKVTPAVMTVGGWFDAEDVQGPQWIYRDIEKNNPKAFNMIVEGPWCHGCWARRNGEALGGVNFGSNTSAFYQENIELPFFNHFLKDKGEMKLPEAYVFESGTNQWKSYETWPPKNTEQRSLYLQANGKLAFSAPTDKTGFDEYVSDPAKPVPFQNRVSIGMNYEYMTDDQRFAATRPDVLVYQTEALGENLTLAGPLQVEMFAATSGTDADFVVKVIDVFPDGVTEMSGYQMLVRGEPMRAKYRDGNWAKPQPLKPNAPTRLAFAMPDVNHTFQRGHRVMLQIQSTWFPLVDRNPQRFENIYQAKDSDFQKATQRIYRAGKMATNVKVTVLK